MTSELQQLEKDALAELNSAKTEDEYLNIKTKYLGRKGLLTGLLRNIAQVSDNEKPLFGQRCNELKNSLSAKIDEALREQTDRNKEEILLKEKDRCHFTGKLHKMRTDSSCRPDTQGNLFRFCFFRIFHCGRSGNRT